MKYDIEITPLAYRQLRKLPHDVQHTINIKLETLASNPFDNTIDVKKLKGRAGYRMRVGDYRVIYEIINNKLCLVVISVAHRREVYN